MDDAHDAEPEQSPYVRLPWPLVAAGLVAILLVALGVGLFANRNLRQAEAIPTPIALAAPVPTATVAPTPAPTPPVLVTPTPPPATAPPTVPPATREPPPPARQSTVVTPRATVSPELAAEIDEAYQQYWQIRAEALYSLDTSRLQEVMAGEHLAAVEDRVNDLRSQGRAIETDVDHNYVVVEASGEDAKVADSYADHSVYIDLQTHARLTTATGETLNELYIMNKTDGIWRVVTLVRSP